MHSILWMSVVWVWAWASMTASQSCTTRCIRREIRTLTDVERSTYFNALKVLLSNGVFDRFTQYHLQFQRTAHNSPVFLPWHRAMMREFEMELQKVDKNVCLNYWSWDVDSQAPEASPLFSEVYFGDHGNGECIRTSWAPDGWHVKYPSEHCIRRNFDGGESLSAFHSMESLNRIMTTSRSYDEFRRSFENVPHATVHSNIGGDMSTMHSPNDPLFYAHHVFIDKIYYLWQKKNPSLARTYSGVDRAGKQGGLGDVLSPWDHYTVESVMDVDALCYGYDEMPADVFGRNPGVDEDGSGGRRTGNRVPSAFVPDEEAREDASVASSPSGDATVVALEMNTKSRVTGNVIPVEVTEQILAGKSPKNASSSLKNWVRIEPVTRTTIAWWSGTSKKSNKKRIHDKFQFRSKGIVSNDEEVDMDEEDNDEEQPGLDRMDLTKLRTPRPIPMDYLRMHGYSVKQVRALEKDISQALETLNRIPGFTSPAALLSRPRLISNKTHVVSVQKGDSERLILDWDGDVQDVTGRLVEVAPDVFELAPDWKEQVKTVTGDLQIGERGSASDFFTENLVLIKPKNGQVSAGGKLVQGWTMMMAFVALTWMQL